MLDLSALYKNERKCYQVFLKILLLSFIFIRLAFGQEKNNTFLPKTYLNVFSINFLLMYSHALDIIEIC